MSKAETKKIEEENKLIIVINHWQRTIYLSKATDFTELLPISEIDSIVGNAKELRSVLKRLKDYNVTVVSPMELKELLMEWRSMR